MGGSFFLINYTHPNCVKKEYFHCQSMYVMCVLNNHPLFPNKKYEKRARIVMAEYLGRSLFFNETVHHKNNNRIDDRIENLELLERENHSQMHACRRYETEKERVEKELSFGRINYSSRSLSMLNLWKERSGEMAQAIKKTWENTEIPECRISSMKSSWTEQRRMEHSDRMKEQWKRLRDNKIDKKGT